MKNLLEISFSMVVPYRDLMVQNGRITSGIPKFNYLLTSLSENLDEIGFIRKQLENDQSGLTADKAQLRSDLVAKALDISRKTFAYANMINDVELIKSVKYSESNLKKGSGYLLKDRAMLICDKAGAHLAELKEYGVTEEMLAGLKEVTELYNAAITKSRLGISERKQANARLSELFEANKAILAKLDMLVEVVRLTEPAFYKLYWENRRLIHTRKGSVALQASITDAVTKTGIRGVKVSFAYQDGNLKLTTGREDKSLIKMTAEKGKFRVKSLSAGTYTVTLSKPGYTEKVVPITVADSETTELVVEMEKM